MAGSGDGGRSKKQDTKHEKSYFDVLGLCCTSEEALVQKMLNSLTGVVSVAVNVPSKTVTVVHDAAVISQEDIVKVLNQARLEATVRTYGKQPIINQWPNAYTLISGTLFIISLFGLLYHPLVYVALGAIGVGIFPIIMRIYAALRVPMVDFNFLMLVAVIGSIVLKDYLEASAIIFLFNLAEWLQSRSTYKAKAVMLSLMSMAPQKAVLADSGLVVDVRDVQINTYLAIKAGEVIPIDGVVTEGSCEVDESSLTGESFPVVKEAQSLVWAGTLNINGYVTIKSTALAENSAVAKMTKLVEEAQNSKSRINRLIDSCVKYYTPAIILAAVAVAVIPLALRLHNLRNWFRLALVLLVSACPCALVLSTPVATFCALNRAATTGLLVKGGDYLEALAGTKTVAFDKTGTLTRGEFTVINFQSIKDDISMETLLYWVSSIESKSSHPMASALINHAQLKSIHPRPDNVCQFQIFPGEGIYGEVDGSGVYIGSRRIALRAGCKTDLNLEEKTDGMTVVYVFSSEVLIGLFSLSDTCRTGAMEAIKDLKLLGNKVAMLTGDSWGSASVVQRQLGNLIDIVHAELLPEDKVRIVHELKSGGSIVMVGDGMNDAPALTAADVGISMGISGSAVAMETSHMTLMSNDVRKIPEAIKLAKKTKWKIIQNIILSMTTKAAIVALAVAGHPLLWAAVLADVGTCLLVVFNSMLLLKKSHRPKKCCSSHHRSHMHAQTGKHSADHSHGDGGCKSQVCHESGGVDRSCCVKDTKAGLTKEDCCSNGERKSVLVSVVDLHKYPCSHDESNEHHHQYHHHHHSAPDANCQSEIVLDSGKHKGKQGHGHHHHYDEELAASRCCPNEKKDCFAETATGTTATNCSDFHVHSTPGANCQSKESTQHKVKQGLHHHHHYDEELAASKCCPNEKKEPCHAGSSNSNAKPAICTAATVCSDFHVHSTPDANHQNKIILDSGKHEVKQGYGHHHHYDEELAASRCCPNEKKESSHVGCRSSSSATPATCSAPTDCSEFHTHAGFYNRGGGTCCRVECMRESCCGSPDHAISC